MVVAPAQVKGEKQSFSAAESRIVGPVGSDIDGDDWRGNFLARSPPGASDKHERIALLESSVNSSGLFSPCSPAITLLGDR
jgi:hypothetical protein